MGVGKCLHQTRSARRRRPHILRPLTPCLCGNASACKRGKLLPLPSQFPPRPPSRTPKEPEKHFYPTLSVCHRHLLSPRNSCPFDMYTRAFNTYIAGSVSFGSVRNQGFVDVLGGCGCTPRLQKRGRVGWLRQLTIGRGTPVVEADTLGSQWLQMLISEPHPKNFFLVFSIHTNRNIAPPTNARPQRLSGSRYTAHTTNASRARWRDGAHLLDPLRSCRVSDPRTWVGFGVRIQCDEFCSSSRAAINTAPPTRSGREVPANAGVSGVTRPVGTCWWRRAWRGR